jgi:hypothetical protein
MQEQLTFVILWIRHKSYCNLIFNSAPCVTCDALSDLGRPDKSKLGRDKEQIFGHNVISGHFLHQIYAFWEHFEVLSHFHLSAGLVVTL